MWYKYTAHNSEMFCGWTTKPQVAKAALARLNRGRDDINLYKMEAAGEDAAETDADVAQAYRNDNYMFNDDTTLDDFESAQAQ